MTAKLKKPFSISFSALVLHRIPDDEALSIPSLFAALGQQIPDPDFIPNTLMCTKITKPLHTVASQNSLKGMSLTMKLQYSFAFPEVIASVVLIATSFTDFDFLQNRTSTVTMFLEKLDSTEWEIKRHTLIHRKIQKHLVLSDLVSESVSQAWSSQALLALSKYSHFLGPSVSEEGSSPTFRTIFNDNISQQME